MSAPMSHDQGEEIIRLLRNLDQVIPDAIELDNVGDLRDSLDNLAQTVEGLARDLANLRDSGG